MPDPPSVSIITRYLLENPWPLGLGLLLVAAVLGWNGMREGLAPRLKQSAALGALGAAVLLVGCFITTSGEHAKIVTRQLVDAVVEMRTGLMTVDKLLAPNAALAVGSPQNPGFDKSVILERIDRLDERYNIESNSITMFKGYSESSDTGTVFLGCMTTVDGFPAISQWVVRVQRQTDDSWKVTHLTCVSINDNTPPLDLW